VVRVWERLPERMIRCIIATDQLQHAKDLLGKRVAVTGRISYRNHKPTSIQVERIDRMQEDSELPELKDIGPINITGGMSPEEYVRSLRDARYRLRGYVHLHPSFAKKTRRYFRRLRAFMEARREQRDCHRHVCLDHHRGQQDQQG